MTEARKQLVIDEPSLMGDTIYLEGLSQKHTCEKYAQWLNDREICREKARYLFL